ncbi:MAG: hypothetical protein K2X08_00210 [Chlamydiales bacterium]|nr:hypothetical protein [Chlamydiales bacterium]
MSLSGISHTPAIANIAQSISLEGAKTWGADIITKVAAVATEVFKTLSAWLAQGISGAAAFYAANQGWIIPLGLATSVVGLIGLGLAISKRYATAKTPEAPQTTSKETPDANSTEIAKNAENKETPPLSKEEEKGEASSALQSATITLTALDAEHLTTGMRILVEKMEEVTNSMGIFHARLETIESTNNRFSLMAESLNNIEAHLDRLTDMPSEHDSEGLHEKFSKTMDELENVVAIHGENKETVRKLSTELSQLRAECNGEGTPLPSTPVKPNSSLTSPNAKAESVHPQLNALLTSHTSLDAEKNVAAS